MATNALGSFVRNKVGVIRQPIYISIIDTTFNIAMVKFRANMCYAIYFDWISILKKFSFLMEGAIR